MQEFISLWDFTFPVIERLLYSKQVEYTRNAKIYRRCANDHIGLASLYNHVDDLTIGS